MRALVTGGSYGSIGGAICLRLAHDAAMRGEHFAIAVASTGARPTVHELIQELENAGANAVALAGDLTDPAVPARLVAEAIEFCGGLDAVVANAGGARGDHPLLGIGPDEWDYIFALNTRATFLLGQAAHTALKTSRGALVAVASIAGVFPYVGLGAYAAAKAGLITLCQTMALEWAVDGIRVNVVSPGTVTKGTDRVRSLGLLKAREAVIPLGRVGSPEDVAGTVAFLLSHSAAYITGENILIDGGIVRSSLNQFRRPGDFYM